MNEKGFTLIEMLVVLLVISILLIITVPNITKNQSTIQSKGCEAFVKMVQSQVQAYEMDKQKLPENITELETGGYLKQTSCPNGDGVKIDEKGDVSVVAKTT
ncbi:prepilin-type N-terminal cleavage/methylation domain-containing protein [Peribacillus cavernae]|uniref:ComG operon protein 3 n=1 Tax=Peribacillus cavernae TaxID=1674310 RepID=A0A433HJJ9_9BACI|nr:competence type IV pilus major pilin ComGC [Peribacillus cavernae]MDQ0218332.1 competence protein ComGC [Peribacillus cavernae]RUQ28389.1 prepilin-type N-terminal cleavage/methylation domain-containing protein [Peribacillus cavernae]